MMCSQYKSASMQQSTYKILAFYLCKMGVCHYFFYKPNISMEIQRAIKFNSSKRKDSIQLRIILAKVFLAHYEILTVEAEFLLHSLLDSGNKLLREA